MEFFSDPLSWEHVCGLRPKLWLVIGAGFGREEVKDFFFSQKKGFLGEAITSLQDLCLKICGLEKEQVLGPLARQEVLRSLLEEPRILSPLQEMKRLKRQRNFLKHLDQAIQLGRMAFAHYEEEEVYHERLQSVRGVSLFRNELSLFSRAYDAWLEASSLYDLPLLIRKTIQRIHSSEASFLKITWPQEICILSTQAPESLEKYFWELLKTIVPIRWMSSFQNKPSFFEKDLQETVHPPCQWEMWHTLDDAAEALADTFLDESVWSKHAVLIPDFPSVRRSLIRALKSREIPIYDPRDPTQLRLDENLKWALLPLEVVASGYERKKVVAWLRAFYCNEKYVEAIEEIHARGIRQGLGFYAGGLLSWLHALLVELKKALGGEKTCSDFARDHLQYLKKYFLEHSQADSTQLLEECWNAFVEDQKKVGAENRRAFPLFWLQRFRLRLMQASPSLESLKPKQGVRIYRLQQSPIGFFEKLWIFGLPFDWLEGSQSARDWYSERDREILSLEFSVRSSVQCVEERFVLLKSWIEKSEQVSVLDAQYGFQGQEQESLFLLLQKVNHSFQKNFFSKNPLEKGAHYRFRRSYQTVSRFPSQTIVLPALLKGVKISATALDRYSRCSFQALGFHRWKLKDLREPDTELWPEVHGNLLHESVRILLKTMHSPGIFSLLPEEALDRAWQKKKPKGLLQSERVNQYIRRKLCVILEKFCEKEKEYLSRSGSQPFFLDDGQLQLDFENFSLIGKPDRVDLHSEGYFIMDYKSSTVLTHGFEMVEQGYRLQLPFYALALQSQEACLPIRPILGIQWIELDRKGGRGKGIFFPSYNGKQEGKLTQVRANSKSLMPMPPQEVWNRFSEWIVSCADAYYQGYFEATPRSQNAKQECSRCTLADLCGLRRKKTKLIDFVDDV